MRMMTILGVAAASVGLAGGALIGATTGGAPTLTGSTLTGSTLTGSTLTGTDPTGTDPTGTDPTGTDPTGTDPTAGDQDPARFRLLCGRVPAAVTRVRTRIERLHGDAQTRGSLAWLQAQADAAQNAGHADRARLLRERLQVRKDLAALLPDRLAMLKDAEQTCAAHGYAGTA